MSKEGSDPSSRGTTAQRIAQRLKARRAESGQPAKTPESASTSDPVDQIRKLAQIVIESWQRAGWLSSRGFPGPKIESPLEKANQKWREEAAGLLKGRSDRLPERAAFFLKRLKRARGLNVVKVEHLLQGKIPPHIDVLGLYQQWRSLNEWASKVSATRKSVKKLAAYYRGFDHRIQSDPALLPSLKTKWQLQYVIIQAALQQLRERYADDPIQPYGDFTVRLNKPLSMQGFWTPVVVALVGIWETKGGSNRSQNFREIARFLSFALPCFPNDPTLIRQRYYYAQKKSLPSINSRTSLE